MVPRSWCFVSQRRDTTSSDWTTHWAHTAELFRACPAARPRGMASLFRPLPDSGLWSLFDPHTAQMTGRRGWRDEVPGVSWVRSQETGEMTDGAAAKGTAMCFRDGLAFSGVSRVGHCFLANSNTHRSMCFARCHSKIRERLYSGVAGGRGAPAGVFTQSTALPPRKPAPPARRLRPSLAGARGWCCCLR